MLKHLRTGLLGLSLLAAGCHHAEPTPPPPETQPTPPAKPDAGPPPPPASTPPMHDNVPQLPKGAHLTESQAEQVALQFAAAHGLPGATEHRVEFKNGAWSFRLRGPGARPGEDNKMEVVVDNAGQVRAWALVPFGSPGWNKAD